MAFPKIDHPLYDIEIPSSKKKYKFRPMLVKEEKITLTAKESKEYTDIFQAIRQIVNNCSVDDKFDVDKIELTDLEWCYLKIKANSINPISKITYQDKEDGKNYTVEVDLTKVTVKKNKELDNVIKINNKVGIVMRMPPSILYADKEFLSDDKNVEENLLLKCIEKIYEGDKMFVINETNNDELKDFIDNLPIPVLDKMREFVSNAPTLYYKVEWTNSLGNKKEVELKSLEDFFIF
jgi:hypothetical protein